MRRIAILSMVILILAAALACDDDSESNISGSIDTVYVLPPTVSIESPSPGDTVTKVFAVKMTFPPEVTVHWARIVDAITEETVSLYDQFFNPLHPGEMTMIVDKLRSGHFSSFYAKTFLTNGDSITSSVVTVSNTNPNDDWPQKFCEITSPKNGDTVYNDFWVTVMFYSDTLPVAAAKVDAPSNKTGSYNAEVPLEIQVGANWWLTDCDSCTMTAQLILAHGELLPESDPLWVHFIKNP